MPIDSIVRPLPLIAVCSLALLAGCAVQGGGSSGPAVEPARGGESAGRAEPGSAESAPAPAEAPPDAPAAPDEQTESVATLIDSILVERRRGDFPEVELQDYGFTITEQVRIAGDTRANYEQALLLLRQERYAEGIAILEEVVATSRDVTVPWIDLGIAYAMSGDLEHAEEALQVAEALSPDNPVIHNELGILYRKSGRFSEARSSYEKALSVFEDFHFARRNLAVLCDLYLADIECALQNYTAYLNTVGSDRDVEIWIADLENRRAAQGGL